MDREDKGIQNEVEGTEQAQVAQSNEPFRSTERQLSLTEHPHDEGELQVNDYQVIIALRNREVVQGRGCPRGPGRSG